MSLILPKHRKTSPVETLKGLTPGRDRVSLLGRVHISFAGQSDTVSNLPRATSQDRESARYQIIRVHVGTRGIRERRAFHLPTVR
jgi:hypothetical protein